MIHHNLKVSKLARDLNPITSLSSVSQVTCLNGFKSRTAHPLRPSMHLTTRALLGKILTRKSSIYRQKRYTPQKKSSYPTKFKRFLFEKSSNHPLFSQKLTFLPCCYPFFWFGKTSPTFHKKVAFPRRNGTHAAGNQDTCSSRHNEKPRVSAKWAQYCRLSWKFSLTLAKVWIFVHQWWSWVVYSNQ